MGEMPKKPSHEEAEISYLPRTPLGERLLRIRQRIVALGDPLLDWNEIDREIADRRGDAGRHA